ncbi:MAG TPA: glycosyltransferase family 1 protein [Candidatus Saccharimonadales bacterium]|nr:glycosyltransferase family 1 protein [Candidatus Saccharimonadales bacterium]
MQRPLRVLLEASCLGDGRRDAGIGRYASQLIEALRDMPGVEATPSVPASPPWSEARPARFLRAQPHVLSEAMARHPHLVHGLGGEPVIGFPTARQVVTLHDVEMWRGASAAGAAASARRLYGAILAPAIRACAAVIAVSATTRTEAIVALGLDPSRIHVVPHGVGSVFSSRPKLRDARTAEAFGLEEPFVLWVGSLRSRDPRKGLDTLLEAMERLPGGGPALALVGALGPEADRLAADAWRRRLRLVLSGPVDDVDLASLYRQAAVVVLPSTHEGFGLTALEAMACGAPLVATSVGNLPRLTLDVAALVPPGDPGALSEAIRLVLAEPVRAARMRHAGIDRASGYTWGRTAAMTAAVYEQVALGGSQPH